MSLLQRGRKSTPTVLQMEAAECGAACLAMILAYHGRYEPLEVLRDRCAVSRNGSKASFILKAARQYGLQSKGYRVLTADLDKLQAPMILFWNFAHFVVYEGHSPDKKHWYINDPAQGPRVVEREIFERSYTGVALEFVKEPSFKTGGKPAPLLPALWSMIADVKSVMRVMIWGGLLMVVPGVTIPALMQVFVDEVLPGKSQWLLPLLGLFVLTMLLQTLLSYLVALALRRGELQLAFNNTMKMLRHMLALPIGFFLQRQAGDLQNRVGLNVSAASTAFGSFADIVVKFCTALFFFVLMLQFSWLLSLLSLLFLAIDLLFLYFISKKRQVLNQSLLLLHSKQTSEVINGIALMDDLKAAGREDSMFNQWVEQLAAINQKNMHFQVSVTYLNMLPALFSALGNVLIVCVGAFLVMQGQLTLGGMFAFQTLSGSFAAPFTALLSAGTELQVMKADLERINDIYKQEPDQVFKASLRAESAFENVAEDAAVAPRLGTVSLELKDVCFGYSRQEPPVLKNLSFKLEPGQRVALVGTSGSGKSTAAKLINATLQPWSGEILLNGRPYSDYTAEEFYSAVGTVDQSVTLFSGTVGDNLTLFSPLKDPRALQSALRDAAIDKELSLRGPVLDLKVQEGGSNFSGGQRQRLEIARVLAQHNALLILDEATSALDPVTEKLIDSAVRRRGCSCVVIAHRLSTVRDCDEIIVLEAGEVVERGKHEQLMAQNGRYAAMMRTQGELS